MASKKKAPEKSQAQRFLEAARKARTDQSGPAFNRAMGKITLAKNGRKPTKMG
jgi:hypothetical protein